MGRIDFNLQMYEATKLLRPYALRLAKHLLHANDLVQDKLAKAVLYQERLTDSAYIMAWLCSGLMAAITVMYHRIRRNNVSDLEHLSHLINRQYRRKSAPKTNDVKDDAGLNICEHITN